VRREVGEELRSREDKEVRNGSFLLTERERNVKRDFTVYLFM